MISTSRLCKGLLGLCLFFCISCKGNQKPQPPPPGQIALKVMTLAFDGSNGYIRAWLLSPLTNERFLPPKYAYHSTEVVAFDPSLPFPRSLRMIWSNSPGAFGPSYAGGSGRAYPQSKVNEWGHDTVIQINGPVPDNPEYLLIILYPGDSVKAELLNQSQVDAGRMDQVIEEFRKTWPSVIEAEKIRGKNIETSGEEQ